MSKLTVIIPTYNEEAYLEDALFSVSFADEIIVIDSFSQDKTPNIAKKHAAKFIQREFDNFSNHKNAALKEATSDWVLFVDADERVTHSLEAEILETIANPKHGGYAINFPHFYMNRFLYHHSDDVIRLVKREGAHFTGTVHEKLHCVGTVGKLRNKMLHYTYKGLTHYINKKESYAWFQAENLFLKKKKGGRAVKSIFTPSNLNRVLPIWTLLCPVEIHGNIPRRLGWVRTEWEGARCRVQCWERLSLQLIQEPEPDKAFKYVPNFRQ